MDRPELAVVIPAFNEASTIGRVVDAASAYGQAIVVDDCSRDETARVAAAAGALVIRHPENRGYDGALNSGFSAAAREGFEYVVTFDADGQHDPGKLGEFLALLKRGNELVLGFRPRPARAGEHIFGLYTRIRFGWRDPMCGMKGYRIGLYRELGRFDGYQSIGTELALYGLKKKRRHAQVPVPITDREDAPRFARIWRANYKILRAMLLSGRAGK